ncbi:MAG TPA: hypothetical protein V6C72_13535 [Chroococcales cyanobacterium]
MSGPKDESEKTRRAGKSEVVYRLASASRCHACDRKLNAGEIVRLKDKENDREALCQTCADLDNLQFVAKGNARITKLASSYSKSKFVVMQWSQLWKCYERQGVLVEKEALDRAEKESAPAS